MRRALALLVIVVAALAAVVASVGPCDAPPDAADEVPAETPRGHTVRTGTATPGAPRPRVRAAADGASSAESRAAGDAPDDDAADLTTPRFPVQVRVVAAATRAPIAGAEVVVDGRPGTTDDAGEATIEGARRGWRAAVVTARGFAPETWWLEVRRDASPQVVALMPGVVVPIEVTDAVTGRPIAGAEVSLQSRATPEFRPGSESGADRASGLVRIVTDAAGRADACLPAETSVRAMTRADRHVPGFDVCRTPAEGTPPPTFRIALAPAGTLRGVVRDPDGAPVAGAIVSVACASEGADGVLESAATGADGAYAVEGLILGATYVASAGKPSQVYAPWVGSADSAPIVPTRECPECIADLRLRRPGAVELVVVGEAGEALEEERMTLSYAGGSTSRWRSGARMSDGVLIPGRYTLRASAPGRVPVEESFDVVEGATETLRIVLTKGVAVVGTVVDPDGAPVPGAGVRTRGQTDSYVGASPASARTDRSGQFSLAPLRIGTHDLLIDPPYEFEGVVVSGVTAPSEGLRVVVPRRGAVSLHAVFEEDAKPEPEARIAFHGTLDGEHWGIDRDLPSDGRFDVTWPAGVSGEVGIAVDGFVAVTRWIDVPTGAQVDLGEVRFRRGVALEGVLRDASGNPLTNRRVSAADSWRGGSCRTDGDGSFRLDGLPAGSVRIDVDSKPPFSLHVTVPRREPIVLVHPGAGTVQVVVLDRAGAPIPGRQIFVRDADGAPIDDGTTDIHGVWTATVTAGRILVEAEGGPSAPAEVRRDDVTLVKLR